MTKIKTQFSPLGVSGETYHGSYGMITKRKKNTGCYSGVVMHQLFTDESGGLPPVGLADLDPCIWRHGKE